VFFQFQSPGLDFGKIENVIDDGQQRLGRAFDAGHIIALPRVQFGVLQQLHHPQNPVHWRTDFMAHIGEKFTLGAVGRLGFMGAGFQSGV